MINAFSHSGAKRVEFQVEYAASDFRIRVWDNGCGIDPGVLRHGRDGHWGLVGMRERATKIGGTLHISSSALNGTEVDPSVPAALAFEITALDHSL